MSKSFLQIHKKDNVLVALKELPKGKEVIFNEKKITLNHAVKAKHKFSLETLEIGDSILMYGTKVGKATEKIKEGDVLTLSNIEHATESYQSINETELKWEAPDVARWENKTFMGYHRSDGSIGTSNHWLVIPLVFCENRNLELLESSLAEALGYYKKNRDIIEIDEMIKAYQANESIEKIKNIELKKDKQNNTNQRVFKNIDGIKFLKHEGGCGGIRQDSDTLCELIAGYLCHPNVGGATILSLGCQNAQVEILNEAISKRDPNFEKPLVILDQQTLSEQLLEVGVKETFLGMIQANEIERKEAPISALKLGLECGGSDGFSGISANPVLGYCSDLLVALGGTTVLAEFPELNGVENELVKRCHSNQHADRFLKMMKQYSNLAKSVGSGFENNPSPGNIKDGLLTDAMKSAGAAKKGGTSPIMDVLDYTEPLKTKGLNLLCTPGNDVESTTALAGSGCNLICFTTGLGTPTGNPITPVVKISSNHQLSQKMNDIIDFNTGDIIDGNITIEQKGAELLDYLIEVASGKKETAADQKGQNDFIPWKRGISL